MDFDKMKKCCAVVIAVYIGFAALFYWVTGDQLHFKDEDISSVSPSISIGELIHDIEIRQRFTAESEEIRGFHLMFSTFSRANNVTVIFDVEDKNGLSIGHADLPAVDLTDNTTTYIPLDNPAKVVSGDDYVLVISSPDAVPGRAVSLWEGTTVSLARAEVSKTIPEEEKLLINGEKQDGMLSFSVRYRTYLWLGEHYFIVTAISGIVLCILCGLFLLRTKQGKSTVLHRVVIAFQKYGFLMKQLISRDFKTKYKRSVLGVLWSFLNPLLTMAVQFIVFSTLFRSDIPNFSLYLLSGIICFSFFSEASNMGLMSIIGNASLITKVYVPKYVYPVSRVLSSTINLLLSLIPLLGVMIITRAPFSPAMLMLPYALICLVAFSIGIALVLSTSMVFFRDTQFLWGVLVMLWMYATPIFYPESIIPQRFMLIYKCNPLYHIIRFFRIILINGVSPEPKAYALCFLVSFVPLLIGALIFKRHQDNFILNL